MATGDGRRRRDGRWIGAEATIVAVDGTIRHAGAARCGLGEWNAIWASFGDFFSAGVRWGF